MTDKGSRRQGEARVLPLTYALSIPQQSNSEYYIYKDYNYPTPPPTLFWIYQNSRKIYIF